MNVIYKWWNTRRDRQTVCERAAQVLPTDVLRLIALKHHGTPRRPRIVAPELRTAVPNLMFPLNDIQQLTTWRKPHLKYAFHDGHVRVFLRRDTSVDHIAHSIYTSSNLWCCSIDHLFVPTGTNAVMHDNDCQGFHYFLRFPCGLSVKNVRDILKHIARRQSWDRMDFPSPMELYESILVVATVAKRHGIDTSKMLVLDTSLTVIQVLDDLTAIVAI